MEFIKCTMRHLEPAARLYADTLSYLEATVNYPRWTKDYPSEASVREAIERGEQYACLEDGRVIGAVVLNDDPRGDYGAGEWSRTLCEGEYLVIHTLAVDPSKKGRGVGGFIVDRCIEHAKKEGYAAIRIDVVPDNYPALALYKKKGFTFAGERDLKRNIDFIPTFVLYELNF
ncbi:MAG: GNAT family N-acetyltransferase [Clostridia bacterium]|nr:GNAT family N-acetyltransferase [Clostridia bacterium]